MASNENVQRDPVNPPPGPLGSPGSGAAPQDDAPLSISQWLSQNAVGLVFTIGLLVFLYMKFDAEGLLAIGKAVLGLGLVVFIHELGHFLAAKWCDVHVTTFSIGFGPNVPGCSFVWGETTYKLGLIPLGGYVQMVGQVDGDESSDTAHEEDPRSFRNKTVGQRMLIISAGVIMNVILAVICFIVVYTGPGKEQPAAVIRLIETGGPSFTEGVRSNAVLLQIDDIKDPFFEDLLDRVTGSLAGQQLIFKFQRPQDKEPTELLIEPKKVGDRNPLIGISPSQVPQLLEARFKMKELPAPVFPDSPAARAQPPVDFGDRIVATTDPDNPQGKLLDLPDDPRHPNKGRRDYFELIRRFQLLAGQPIKLLVERGDPVRKVEITVPAGFSRTLGVRFKMGQIANIRKSTPKMRSPAAEAGVLGPRPDPNDKSAKPAQLQGDIIEAVELVVAKKVVQRWDASNLDPERLPFELRQKIKQLGGGAQPSVKLELKRHRPVTNVEQYENVVVDLEWQDEWSLDRFFLADEHSPLPIAELGLAYRINPIVAGITGEGPKPYATPWQTALQAIKDALRSSAAALKDKVKSDPAAAQQLQEVEKMLALVPEPAVLQKDQIITKVEFFFKDFKGLERSGGEIPVEPESWAYLGENLRENFPISRVTVWVDGNKKKGEDGKKIELLPVTDPQWPVIDRGFRFDQDLRTDRADSIVAAVGMGFKHSHRSMMRVYRNLRGLVLARLSPERSLAGPLRMGEMAYRIARFDFWEFLFFLGLISINLAVINFLPIPVLDGGHMVFLLYEKFRGKPASEGIRVGATYLGLALILCLMGFVLYLDISYYLK